jgi:hypothetical protein
MALPAAAQSRSGMIAPLPEQSCNTCVLTWPCGDAISINNPDGAGQVVHLQHPGIHSRPIMVAF